MAVQPVFLEYAFLFDPSDTWPTLWEFEKGLGSYFRSINMEAEVVTSNAGKKILILKKVEEPKVPLELKEEKLNSVNKQLQNIQLEIKRDEKGRFGK